MSHILLGTAGHIDHGKTTLVKALTGVDADRLKEEKARGITIDLGFAHMTLPSGRKVGIVDVPGHERFIKNMVSGAGGIDIVMLIIAADEGIMPQTKEHLNILKLLKVKRGLIALTKTDIVDGEWLEMVREEVTDKVRGTFLDSAPIIPVSSVTGEGIPELIEAIDSLTGEPAEKDNESPFRLPVDRVFSLKGIGTVVTGSLLQGKVKVGEEAQIYPQGIVAKIKSVQIDDTPSEGAQAGQRAALNLSDVKVSQISRGDVISFPDSLLSVTGVYARLELLEDAPFPVKHRQRVRFHVGTKEALGRVHIMEGDVIMPSGKGYFYIALEEPVVCSYKDKFILRSYSPVTTLGGGEVIYPNTVKLKRQNEGTGVKVLERAFFGGLSEAIEGLVSTFGPKFSDIKGISRYMGKSADQINEALEGLKEHKKVKVLFSGSQKIIMSDDSYGDITKDAEQILSAYHKSNPLKPGMGKEELRSRLELPQGIFDALLVVWMSGGLFETDNDIVLEKSFKITLTPQEQKTYDDVLVIYEKAFSAPPDINEVLSDYPSQKQKHVTSVLDKLLSDGKLIKINQSIYMASTVAVEAKRLLKEHYSQESDITVAQFRDLLGTTRKYALPLLEYLDKQKITCKIGDVRVAGSCLGP